MFCKECGTDIPDDAQFCPFCGKVLEMELKKDQIESLTLDDKLEEDFDLHLDWASETSVIHQGMRTKIFLRIAKITSAPVYGAKVQLSGPPQVEIVIKSSKIHPKKITNKIFFPISAKEPGLFTLTATLTSDAGHRITFPFKIRVEPTKTLFRGETQYSDETRTKTATYSSPSPSTSDNLIAARIIFGIIGLFLILAAVGVTLGGLGGLGGFGGFYGSTLPFIITLAVIGVVILAIVTKGICCCVGAGCDCGDCDCDC